MLVWYEGASARAGFWPHPSRLRPLLAAGDANWLDSSSSVCARFREAALAACEGQPEGAPGPAKLRPCAFHLLRIGGLFQFHTWIVISMQFSPCLLEEEEGAEHQANRPDSWREGRQFPAVGSRIGNGASLPSP
ncbi:hypothetical protein NDU88_000905 [Pleurodeles waltl]|uniref:Uncharacterized protein n=1 Tax=Pleurodeles waltl TaxID=8319 RepID=A0AAV7V6D7_PLEWA|nr:hypothetical protein NDU88_000905 [Pleurodeles waltl]